MNARFPGPDARTVVFSVDHPGFPPTPTASLGPFDATLDVPPGGRALHRLCDRLAVLEHGGVVLVRGAIPYGVHVMLRPGVSHEYITALAHPSVGRDERVVAMGGPNGCTRLLAGVGSRTPLHATHVDRAVSILRMFRAVFVAPWSEGEGDPLDVSLWRRASLLPQAVLW